MYRVIAYDHPIIKVQHTNGTTYQFTVNDAGELEHDGRTDLGDARRLAIAHLSKRGDGRHGARYC
jgi:predicted RNA-binding protein with TRAM domain